MFESSTCTFNILNMLDAYSICMYFRLFYIWIFFSFFNLKLRHEKNISTLPKACWIPDKCQQESLKEIIKHHISHILLKYVDFLKPVKSVVPPYIAHKFIELTKTSLFFWIVSWLKLVKIVLVAWFQSCSVFMNFQFHMPDKRTKELLKGLSLVGMYWQTKGLQLQHSRTCNWTSVMLTNL